MALIQLGAIVSDISGSIGGTTFQQSGGGLIARSKPMSNKALTPKRSAQHNAMSVIVQDFKGLTPEQIAAWNAFAKVNKISTRGKGPHFVSGRAMYKHINGLLRKLTGAVLDYPPTDLGVPPLQSLGVTGHSDPGGSIVILGTSDYDVSNCWLNVYASKYQNQTHGAFYGKYGHMRSDGIPINSIFDCTLRYLDLYNYKRGVQGNRHLYIKAQIVKLTNGSTSPFLYADFNIA